ncbi:MAG TPA: DUF2938 domain-containing protein [Gemmatimonadaceae bacterium]|nr:DUF2938 domain-containing protein [Gemmatimonadaceae bacterium]
MQLLDIANAVSIGVGATLLIDLWALVLRRVFSVRSLDYCLLGRWVLHIPHGVVRHDNITAAARQPHECTVGWTTHYLIGTGFAILFVLLASADWLAQPTLLPALAFGAATVVVPFFTMQPSFGLGIAASKTPHPNQARLKSLMTHTIFGVGLYLSAALLNAIRF